MKESICTVHQALSDSGSPYVSGSEVRLPNGEKIPSVLSVSIEAIPGLGAQWVATIKIPVVFGDPVAHKYG